MEKKEFVFIQTPSCDAIERSAGVLQLAANMAVIDGTTAFFLMNEGVRLARKGFAESIIWQKNVSQVATLMTSLPEEFDSKFFVCASYVKPNGVELKEWN